MRCGGRLLILDAGTGLRALGQTLMANGAVDVDLFLSHTHIDHIAGLPFFRPMYTAGNTIRLWAGHLAPEGNLNDVLCRVMSSPLFPVPFDILAADIDTNDFEAGLTLEPGPGITVRTAALSHPDRATGYRIDFAGKSACYVTDTEHEAGRRNPAILDLIRGADLFIYDSTYTDEEYPRFKGWGHSTWQEGVRLANDAGVKTYAIFHHDPDHDDQAMDRIGAEAQKARPGTVVAHEGLILTL
jgi:phosphoribosyl 1,2-cyclic phosphodiesterase